MGQALGALYIFFIGATGGALLAGLLVERLRHTAPRSSCCTCRRRSSAGSADRAERIVHPRRPVAGRRASCARSRTSTSGRRHDPDDVPALQVSQLDFSYGQVQVLFDVGFEVRKGEVLALLGTNGAGKSTILRVIAGLGTPARGVVRLNGRTITYVTPEKRARLGIRMLPGRQGRVPRPDRPREPRGGGVRSTASDRADDERRDRPVRWRPVPGARRASQTSPRRRCRAASSRCSPSPRCSLHEPEILIIDELSLGLAPIMVAASCSRSSSSSRARA